MGFRIVIFIMLAIIIYSLGSGLYYLVRQGAGSKGMVKALTWRIILSLSLFVLIIVAYFLGWVTPHPIMVTPQG